MSLPRGIPHRPLVMGVVNVTPDSFSDGGDWFDADAAIAHCHELVAQGAQILDVGGESTRPGAARPSEDEELRRVLPVVRALAPTGIPISVDTMRASVAEQALSAGAGILNDVSGGLADARMVGLAAEAGVPYIAMHWRGHSDDMYARAVYDDVVGEVCDELRRRADECLAAGISGDNLVLDPGLGFAKTAEHNWSVLRGLGSVVGLGFPVLFAASRKGFLGRVGRAAGAERAPKERDVATAATSLYAAQLGVWAVRVHDVAATVDALDVAQAIAAAR